MWKFLYLTVVTLTLALAGAASNAAALSPAPSSNAPSPEESASINQLLANYTKSVSDGNRILFESQLLDLAIPFSGVSSGTKSETPLALRSVQGYGGFRKAIFDSGEKFQQRFTNIKIEQVGNLAQVSLDYETAVAGTPYVGKGWKTLQLIKFNGNWKIVSEFYVSYPNH